jgi:hypothetical protein
MDSLQICLVGNEWVKEWRPLVIWTDTSSETSVGTHKLEETIKKPYIDVLAHTPEVCKGIPSDQRVLGCKG